GGQSWEVEVELTGSLDDLLARFEDAHERLYGVRGEPGSPIEIRTLRLAGLGPSAAVDALGLDDPRPSGGTRAATFEGETSDVPLRSRASIADEMATTIFRTAHSTVVRDGMDFSAAICDPNGETVAQGVTVPFHLGSVPHAMKTLLAKFGDELHPGDVFVMNDPFDGGIHLQDIFVFKPIFCGERLIGFATTTAHHGDVG